MEKILLVTLAEIADKNGDAKSACYIRAIMKGMVAVPSLEEDIASFSRLLAEKAKASF